MINRSSKYKNRYIHRRDSLSLAALSLDDRDKVKELETLLGWFLVVGLGLWVVAVAVLAAVVLVVVCWCWC